MKKLIAAWLLLVPVAIFAAGPQVGGFGFGGNPRPNTSLAQFEFAPASGAGMGTVCSGATVSGAKGEVFSFTRGSNGTCTRGVGGLRTTSIANGDLVILSSNQPRVEYDSTGVLGILSEISRTNAELRSREIENVAWSSGAVGVAGPVVTANAATAPDGTSTADRLDFAATNAGQASTRFQAAAGGVCDAAVCFYSVYVEGVSGSGTIDIGAWGTTFTTTPCSFVSTSWTRCIYSGPAGNVGSGIFFGNDTRDNGGTTRPAQSVYVWGAQGEVGSYATSYIPTTSAAVTRSADTGFFTLQSPISSSTGSNAASFEIPAVAPVAVSLIFYQTGASPLYVYPSSQLLRTFDGTNEITNNTPAMSPGVVYRGWSNYTGATQTVTDWAPDTASGAFDGQMGTTTLSTISICGLDNSQASFICTRICADSSASRCR